VNKSAECCIFRLVRKRKASIGQTEHVTFGLFREIGQVDPEPRFSIARRMALGLPRMSSCYGLSGCGEGLKENKLKV